LIGLAGAVSLAHALWSGTVVDDAGIALAYARSLAYGQGLRLTPLSPRVEAYSDPLWVLWLAVPYMLHIDGPTFAHLSGALLGAAAVVVTGFVPSFAEARAPRLLDAAVPWVLSLDTTFNFWAGAGLETGAFALALAAMLALLAAGSRWSFAPAGLLAVLRPEGALYAALAVPFRSRRDDRPPPPPSREDVIARAREIVWWLALAALPALVWLLFRIAYYRQWLPNSFFAKRTWQYGGVGYLRAWFVQDPWHWVLCFSPVAFISRRTRRSALAAYSACAAAAIFIVVSGGDWMIEHRFVAHALPAAALAAGLVPFALDDLLTGRGRIVGGIAGLGIVAAAFFGAQARSPARRLSPELSLAYVADQGRWFHDEARRLGVLRPRIAHFDIGGLALESGGEVIDLGGLADLYIGRIGYHDRNAVGAYVFDEVEPDMLNIHGPVQYLRDDWRLRRDYVRVASGLWGENWVRKSLVRNQLDDRCAAGGPPVDLDRRLANATPVEARDLWLCARAHLLTLPDVTVLARRFAAESLRDPHRARELLEAAVTLDPTQAAAAGRLLRLRLQR